MLHLQKRFPFPWAAALALFTLALLWPSAAQIALAQEFNWTGHIEVLPAGAGSGQWVVNGRSFTVGAETELRTDKGPFAVGVCVEVEYVGATEPYNATKIASKSSDDCSNSTPVATTSPTTSATPDATTSPTASVTPVGTTTPGGEREAKGRVEAKPSPGLVGAWTINGVNYTATANTRFRQEKGPLVMGACVEVEFVGTNAPFTATKIQSSSADDCQAAATTTPGATASVTPGATPSPTTTPTGESELYGRVESLPAGRIGAWQISGASYTATANTEFKEEHGALAVGACVKLHVQTTTTPATIRELETEQDFHCTGNGGSSAEGEIFGVLQSFPAALVGEWNIGGMTFVANDQTEFKQENGAFAVGVTVKVHFRLASDGSNLAREIETKFANDDDGNDDDNNGARDGAEGQAFGKIDAFPAELVGEWQIGGLSYTATASAKFKQDNGAFAQGGSVKVEFYRDSQGRRIAHEIETTSDNGGVDDNSHAKLAGFVQSMPTSGFVGQWQIGDVTFSASANTKFKEDHGLLALGAYVTVEYAVSNGVNTIHEIETQVPPGGGDDNRLGQIESVGLVQQAGLTANQTWRIAGANYTITPATILNDSRSNLVVGQAALVNSYTAADGSLVATRVQGLTEITSLYLSLIDR